MPLIWLPFMIWFFVNPGWEHAGPLRWIGNTLYGIVFILVVSVLILPPRTASSHCSRCDDRDGHHRNPDQRRRQSAYSFMQLRQPELYYPPWRVIYC